MAAKHVQETEKADSSGKGAFDVVIVPLGSVDKDLVVGRVNGGKVLGLSAGRIARAKEKWLEAAAPASLSAHPGLLAAAEGDAGEGQHLLEELAATMSSLAEGRAAFRAELQSVLDEGERLLEAAVS